MSLAIEPWRFRLEGLDASLDESLRRRWGQHVSEGEASLTVRLVDGGDTSRLAPPAAGEAYRVEASVEDGSLRVRSESFELAPETPERWRLAIARDPGERLDRLVENAVRYLVARAAAEAGGLAFHGAAVLRDGKAHLLLGPSGAGKTTAVGLLAPAVSLGDDFAAALPDGASWVAPSVPFDNLERVPPERPQGAFPIAGIWRLFRSSEDRVERPLAVLAASSLMTCAAMPWAMPDLSGRLLENASRLLHRVPYAHLHFRRTSDLASLMGTFPE
jgi:hypothetical protein